MVEVVDDVGFIEGLEDLVLFVDICTDSFLNQNAVI